MVGALARFHLNAEHLYPSAAELARYFGVTRGCCNPYMNTVVQLVETVHAVEHSLELVAGLLAEGITPEQATGKRVVVVANLAKRAIRGIESCGMLLAAGEPTAGLTLVEVPGELPPGTRIK